MSEDQLRREIRVFRKSPDFVERIAVAAVVSFSDDGSLFAIDFLKPSLDLTIEGKDSIVEVESKLEQCVRIYLTPLACKRLFQTLSMMIEYYERRFGKIKED